MSSFALSAKCFTITSSIFSTELLPQQLLDVVTMMTLKLSLDAFCNFTTDRRQIKNVEFIRRIDFMQFVAIKVSFHSLVDFA
jgi:hypothetical protein